MSDVFFYDPHDPTAGGAAIPMPSTLFAAAQACDGLTDALENVVDKFSALADTLIARGEFAESDVHTSKDYIALKLIEHPGGRYVAHSWRLIRYRPVGTATTGTLDATISRRLGDLQIAVGPVGEWFPDDDQLENIRQATVAIVRFMMAAG